MPLNHRIGSALQRGLSLVELMVGITVGLFVLAGATLLVSTQLGDNRRLLLETQIQQDLRASMDIMTRELRRAGSVPNAAAAHVWQPGFPVAAPSVLTNITLAEDGKSIEFRYRRGGAEGPYGYRWDEDGGRIQTQVGAGNWQELTDTSVMQVTDFSVVAEDEAVEQVPCARACSADPNDTACWPTITVRTYSLTLAVQSSTDPAVQRRQSSRVRLRNDLLGYNGAPGVLCPA